MAVKLLELLIDDLELRNNPGSQVPADETVHFTLDGVEYMIDLTSKNADSLRSAIAPYCEAARRVGGRKRNRSKSARDHSARIREWARDRGMKVSEKGRIPGPVVAEYNSSVGQAA